MRLSMRYTLIIFSGLLTIADTGRVSIAGGLNHTTHIFTSAEKIIEPNGLNHLYLGGKYNIKEHYNLF